MQETKPASDEGEPWFAGKDVEVMVYKINRRPLSGDPQLFRRPELLEHLETVLSGGHFAITGRRFQRRWRTGDRRVEGDAMTGLIGWSREGQVQPGHSYDEATESWLPEAHVESHSAVAPFAVIREGHYIGVLRHPTFQADSVAAALQALLNLGETLRTIPTTDWMVEPVGNEPEFLDWLTRVDRITEVRFVFRRPNPDGEDRFQHLFDRMDRMHADQIEQSVKQHNPDAGLDRDALMDDPEIQEFLAAAMEAFGYVAGEGYVRGKRTAYNQQDRVLKEPVENLDGDWDRARSVVTSVLRRIAGRRRDGG